MKKKVLAVDLVYQNDFFVRRASQFLKSFANMM